ncbi:MAG TPA: nitrilase family protein [Puia sp.]|nr:nitrilase family protein [Puia sp.]
MENLNISTAQFEHRSGDKLYNLQTIDRLTEEAARAGPGVIAFHETSVTGYTFARDLSKAEMLALAEYIPEGETIGKLVAIARKHRMVILAGLFEKDQDDNLYNAYVCVDEHGLVARHRKIHPFINSYLVPGNEYTVFNILGWNCGILICYDNNIIENVRATALLGADIIFMPHVTMCTPSTRPGAGFVDPSLWMNRIKDPDALRAEFDGLKGRSWLMKWLPARAYDNGIYVVFSNPIGMDHDQVKNGCSVIIDPFGEILHECRMLGDQVVTALAEPGKLTQAGGYRYRKARRPDLYADIIGRPHHAELKVIWLNQEKN